MRILVVEDDELVADAVARGLRNANFAVDQVGSAESARTAFSTTQYDAAVIDIGLPDGDGFTLVGHLRKIGKSLPILMLTARQTVDDKVRALELGADDFLIKPFSQDELLARCRALIRRANMRSNGRTVFGSMQIDFESKHLAIAGEEVELTAREWTIFEYFVLHAGRILSKERLMQTASSWDCEITPNAIEVYVSRLRTKLGDAAIIRSLRGLGYRLEEPK